LNRGVAATAHGFIVIARIINQKIILKTTRKYKALFRISPGIIIG
jgi:hypothetical protein